MYSQLSRLLPSDVIRPLVCVLGSHSPLTMMVKGKLNVQSFPRPPLLEKTPRHLQIKWEGYLIADTKDAFWILETHHPPSRFYSSLFRSPHLLIGRAPIDGVLKLRLGANRLGAA